MLKDLKVSFFLASRSVLRGDKSSFVMVVLIMMVVFLNFLFTDSIFSGIAKSINEGRIKYEYGHVVIEPYEPEKYVKDTRAIKDYYKDNLLVEKVTSSLTSGAVFVNEKKKDGRNEKRVAGSVIGVDSQEPYLFDIESILIDGRYFEEGEHDKIIVGSDLLGGYGVSFFPENLDGLKLGDEVKVEYAGVEKEYEIIGVYRTKNSILDRNGFISRRDLTQALGTTDESSKVVLYLNNKEDYESIIEDLSSTPFSQYHFIDWKEKSAAGAGINESFSVVGSVLRVISSFVASLVIFIIIFVDIVNRKKQIGVLKAIGIQDHIIINSYIMRGVLYAILGIILGYILMTYVVIGIFERSPLDLPMANVVPYVEDSAMMASIIFFLASGFVGSFLPAFKEIRKKTLDLLYR